MVGGRQPRLPADIREAQGCFYRVQGLLSRVWCRVPGKSHAWGLGTLNHAWGLGTLNPKP